VQQTYLDKIKKNSVCLILSFIIIFFIFIENTKARAEINTDFRTFQVTMNIPSSCNINIDNTKLLDGASNVLLLAANVKVECNTTSAIVKLINKNLEEFKNNSIALNFTKNNREKIEFEKNSLVSLVPATLIRSDVDDEYSNYKNILAANIERGNTLVAANTVATNSLKNYANIKDKNIYFEVTY
jgi:hypothetical protein